MSMDSPNKPLIFYSYAHEDEKHVLRLQKSLSLLKREGKVLDWYDGRINAGDNWNDAIRKQLENATIILFLVSPDFMASDYCWGVEVRRAMERNSRGEAVVIPVILRSSDWQDADFGQLQALPSRGKPITSWPNRDEAWTNVTKGIRSTIDRL